MSRKEEATTKRRKRKLVDKDVEVVVANNANGMFVYESKNGDLSIDLSNFGETEYVTYGELRKLKPFLTNGQLVISEVNDDDTTIMDVVRGMRLTKLYDDILGTVLGYDPEEFDGVDLIDPADIEEAVLESDESEFEDMLKSKFRSRIIEITVGLYKERRLSDRDKIELIEETRPEGEQETFWSDINASMKFGRK